ncbi:Ig-like domain-containing protein [bacterium]|nr:Ig-like domain-containing protein [bacterium]
MLGPRALAVGALLMAAAPAAAVTHVCGTLTADATWVGGEVYVMDCTVTVPAGRTLRVEPGAVVKLGLRDFFVDGELIAAGSPAAPVVFTSLEDDAWGGDTNGDGPSAGQPGQWAALTFNPGSRGRLSDAILQYGGGFYFHYSSKALLRNFGGDVALERVTLRGSAVYGLYAASPVNVTESVVGDNGDWGLYYDGLGDGAPLAIVDNVFSGPYPGLLRLGGEHGMVTLRGNRIEGAASGFSLRGELRAPLEWDNDPSFVMIVSSDLRVAPSGSLRLAPGSIVKLTFGSFNGGELIVEGTLEAAGSPEAPVVFTSLEDDAWGGDTNGDGALTAAAPGQWSAITFAAGSRGRISDAIIRYGGGYYFHYSSKALIRAFSDDVVLDGVELSGSGRYGIYAENGPMLVRRGRITDNAEHAVFNQTPALAVDARRCWWGDPSGPAHPTRNPAGQGGRVSDGVLFFPWAVDEQGTLATQVLLGGPSRVSPGDTVDYAVSYFAGEAIDDAVLKVALPAGAEYVAGDGVFWARNGEVFWTLGDLAPFSEGIRSVRLRFPWGLSEARRIARGLLDGSNVDGGGHEFDTAPYYAYARPPAGAAETLDAEQIAPLIAARTDVAAMVDAARAAGLTLIGGARWARQDRSSLEALLIGPSETRSITWDDAGLLALALRPEGAVIADASGALRIDSGDGAVTADGAWAEAGPAAPATTAAEAISKGACLNNCIVQGGISLAETGGLAPQAVSPRLATQQILSRRLWPTLTSKACQTICARLGDCGLCLQALLDEKQGLPEIEDLLFTCSRGCDDAGTRRTARCDYTRQLPPPEPPPILVCEGGIAAHGVSVSVLRCDQTTGAWRREPGLAFECLCLAQDSRAEVTCTQQGIGVACSTVPDRATSATRCGDTYTPRTVAQGYEGYCTARRFTGYWGTPPAAAGLVSAAATLGEGDCSEVSTTVRVARDPNEKAGASGDVVPGDLLTYTVAFENEGAGRAYGVYVVDDLSPHLDESTLDLMGAGTFYPTTRTILWDVGELAPKGEAGSTGERTFTVRVRADAASGTVIANQAVVYFPSVPEETATNTVVNAVQPVAATPQTLATDYATPIAITLRGRDAAGAALAFAVDRQPANGVLTGTPPNLMYLPEENFVGQDRLTFTASNGVSESLPAAVIIVVQPSPADVRPPQVVWTYPPDGAAWPAPPTAPLLSDASGPLYGPALAIGFSELMDAATIDADSFAVRDQRGRPIEAQVSWDAAAYRALLAPRAPWERGRYTATVTDAARDASGNPLPAAYAWTFRVGECVGDCNGDGMVSIDELIRGVNIALGSQPVAACPSFDANGSGTVDIAELITAVNAALAGC